MKGVIVQVTSDRPGAPADQPPHGADLANLEILVVDDSYHMRRLLRTLLQVLKVRNVHEAENGADALAALRSSAIDIVLADCQMQPVDGIQLAQKIRRSDKLPNPAVPIIMISGHSSPELITQARDVGVHEFLLKPASARPPDLFRTGAARRIPVGEGRLTGRGFGCRRCDRFSRFARPGRSGAF